MHSGATNDQHDPTCVIVVVLLVELCPSSPSLSLSLHRHRHRLLGVFVKSLLAAKSVRNFASAVPPHSSLVF